MKRYIVTTFLTFFAVLAGAAQAQAPNLEQMDLVMKSIPDGPVAKVNDTYVPRRDFVELYQSELNRVAQARAEELPPGGRVQLALMCLGRLIEEELLYQEAKERDLSISKETLRETAAGQFASMRRGLSESRSQELTDQEMLELLGYENEQEMLDQMERFLLIEKMRQRIVKESGVQVSDEEVQKIFDDRKDQFSRPDAIHLKQIFVRGDASVALQGGARESARKRAQEAMARIQAGQSFEAVAKAVSEAPGAQDRGDMGPMAVNQLPEFMVEPALKMDPGEISDVIESQHGFHIIKLVDIVPGSEASLGEAESMIKQSLLVQKGQEEVHEYCDRLIEEEADVRVYIELEKTLSLDPEYSELKVE